MKTEFLDVSDTRKQLVVEIPSTVVDAEIDRVARDYSKAARIPGFRPGKVPTKVVRQRFRDQILHDVAHDLIPRAVDDALRERGVEPVDTPDIRDVLVEEGQPLKFTANFETVPAFDPGDYGTLQLRKPPVSLEDDAVEQALERLRQRAARYEPVEARPVESRRHSRRRSPARVERRGAGHAQQYVVLLHTLTVRYCDSSTRHSPRGRRAQRTGTPLMLPQLRAIAMRSGRSGAWRTDRRPTARGSRSDRLVTASRRCIATNVAGSRVRSSAWTSARASIRRLTPGSAPARKQRQHGDRRRAPARPRARRPRRRRRRAAGTTARSARGRAAITPTPRPARRAPCRSSTSPRLA